MREILRNRDFSLLWASGAFDNTGRWMDTVVMGLLVLQQTDSPFQVALLFVVRWFPMFIFSVFSGMIADRVNRWRVILGTRCGSVAVTAVVLCLVVFDVIRPWHLFLASMALGWIYVLEFPSRRSMIYEIVGNSHIVSAMSLETFALTIGRIVGPLAAGFLIELSGFTAPYIFLLVGYALALGSFSLIKTRLPAPSSGPSSMRQNFIDGLTYAFNHRVIRGVLAITLIMNALAFSVESLFPVVAKDHLNVGAGLTGVMISALSIGSFIAAGAIAWFGVIKFHGRVFSGPAHDELAGRRYQHSSFADVDDQLSVRSWRTDQERADVPRRVPGPVPRSPGHQRPVASVFYADAHYDDLRVA